MAYTAPRADARHILDTDDGFFIKKDVSFKIIRFIIKFIKKSMSA